MMGSEGYLINELLAARTNQREDEWGGDYSRRMIELTGVALRLNQFIGAALIRPTFSVSTPGCLAGRHARFSYRE